MGERNPLPFSSFSSFSPFLLPSPAAKRLNENPLGGLGELCNFPPVGSAYTFWCILSLKIAPGGNIFYKCPKKKQLYRQEVPERRSKIYTNKKFPGEFRISGGGISPAAVCLEETLYPARKLYTKTPC